MHEFGIAQGLLEAVIDRAHETGTSRIESVRLEIGVLAGVENEALRFAFNALAEGTIAQGAQLDIHTIPLRCHCEGCAKNFECRPFAYRCPDCGAASAKVVSGKEMNLVSMEVT